jgi:drug/metabolite transporter (DMT)-like permease
LLRFTKFACCTVLIPPKSMKDVQHERRQRLTGIALMCGAVASFAFLDATAKYLSPQMPTSQIVAARYISAFLLALILINPITHPRQIVTRRPVMQIIRSMLMLGTTVFNFIALRYLQLDQTISIVFSTPFLVALLAGRLLGESLDWRRWSAIVVGFAGVLLVTRPGAGGIHPAALLSVAGAICYAIYAIMTRALSRIDSNETTLFYSNLIGAVVMVPVLPFVWTPPQDVFSIVLMVVMGAFGGFGHFLLIIAHRLAPASVLSPFIYSQMIWMIGLGYLVFGDVPNHWTMAGAAVVIASGLYLIQHERRRRVIPPAPDIVT